MQPEDKTIIREEDLIGDHPGESKSRKSSHEEDSHEGGGHGGTEMGWLVSYADMMTLLFGLFVILYVLKSDKTKDADQIMRQVSNQYFAASTEGAPADPTTARTPAEESPQSPEDAKAEIEEMKAAVEAQQNELKNLAAELEAKQEALKSAGESFEKDKKAFSAQQAETKKRMVDEKPTDPLQQEIEDLQKKIADKEAENEKLQEALSKSQTPMQNYLMVLLVWETEKHDLDLQVVNPNAKNFSFKRRKIANEAGAFELDSRYGPGIEMWKAENFAPGTYSAKTTLYAQNDNRKPARARLMVTTNLETYNSDFFEIKKTSATHKIKFTISPDGSVSFPGTP